MCGGGNATSVLRSWSLAGAAQPNAAAMVAVGDAARQCSELPADMPQWCVLQW
jgi:hypothetical protein